MVNIKNIVFNYGHNTLYNGVSTSFEPGKIYGFLGKNGAGKTTLFKIMCGLLMADEGECRVFDYDSSSRHPGMLKDLFFISESFYLPPISISRYEQLHAPFYDNFDSAEFDQMLIELELGKDRLLNTLSYGLKKRFLLAFGLASNTRLLLLDEPTNGLDIPSKRILRKMLASAINENRTFVIATHQIREIENIFDSLVFIDQGKILLDTSIENISRKLSFDSIPITEDHTKYLYAEEVSGRYSVISKNETGEEGTIDIEFLFNAVTDHSDVVIREITAE